MAKKIITNFPFKFDVVENDFLVLKDGTKLSFRAWYPKSDKPLPSILEYIPYRKTDGTRTRDEPMHGFFAGHGYNVLRVDMRGTGESDGFLRGEYLLQEQDDALEVIEWISKQSWCDGKVGMMGKSWGGFNSLQVAARRPKALKAVIAVGFTDDRYNEDIHYKGGCLLNDNFWWGNIMLAYQSRAIDPKIVGEKWRQMWLDRLSEMPLWMADWLEHQTRDEFWKHGSVCEDYNAIEVPVFAIDGWADSYMNSVFSLIKNLNVPKKGIIGPWAHVYSHDGFPEPAMDFLGEAVKWWDHWLKDVKNDTLKSPMIQAWMEDYMPPSSKMPKSDGRWVGFDSFDEIEDEIMYLKYANLTKEKSSSSQILKLKTPLNHGLLSGEWMGAAVLGESPCDQRIDNGMSVVFDSQILENSVEILGFPKFEVSLSSDKECAMLYASLCDVAPDGSSKRVSYGVMNLTHLQGHDKVVKLKKDEFVRAFVKLDCCGYKFPKGHRIRLSIANSFWPMFWVMPEISTLSLDLNTAKLTLPISKAKSCTGPSQNAQSAPLTPLSLLSEGKVSRSVSYDIVDDAWTCITDGVGGVFGEGIYRFDEIDVTVEHNLKRELFLPNNDPLKARYTITQKMKLGREGWWTNADIVVSQSADKENFIIQGDMKVSENDKVVFTKVWDKKIKRNGM